jgi:hypothetical protein
MSVFLATKDLKHTHYAGIGTEHDNLDGTILFVASRVVFPGFTMSCCYPHALSEHAFSLISEVTDKRDTSNHVKLADLCSSHFWVVRVIG